MARARLAPVTEGAARCLTFAAKRSRRVNQPLHHALAGAVPLPTMWGGEGLARLPRVEIAAKDLEAALGDGGAHGGGQGLEEGDVVPTEQDLPQNLI